MPTLMSLLTGSDADLQSAVVLCLTNMAAAGKNDVNVICKTTAPYLDVNVICKTTAPYLVTYLSGSSHTLQVCYIMMFKLYHRVQVCDIMMFKLYHTLQFCYIMMFKLYHRVQVCDIMMFKLYHMSTGLLHYDIEYRFVTL